MQEMRPFSEQNMQKAVAGEQSLFTFNTKKAFRRI